MPCRNLWLLLVVVLTACDAVARDRDVWPMEKGTYWTYRAEVQSEQPENGILAAQLSWRMEVIDTYRRGPIRAVLMRGHPADLAFYTPKTQPSLWVMARSGNHYYILRDPSSWARLHNPSDLLEDLIVPANEFFLWLMKQGDLFGQEPRRDDTFYGWFVEEQRPADLSTIFSSPAVSDAQEYRLAYRTIGGSEIITFVPGIGITRYIYHHNGTTSDVDAVLIDMNRQGRKASRH
ncbi:MAG TPA: hypothetical protein VD837_11885 [Terriglobales bacterium]|nr:hypothetical protein [Terriglobales bacterium]